jgi:hypothetical protein
VVWCLVVWCLVSGVWCLVSGYWPRVPLSPDSCPLTPNLSFPKNDFSSAGVTLATSRGVFSFNFGPCFATRFFLFVIAALAMSAPGYNAIPDIVRQPTYHNPFPQLERVAALPFNNLSDNPHVDGDLVARAY